MLAFAVLVHASFDRQAEEISALVAHENAHGYI